MLHSRMHTNSDVWYVCSKKSNKDWLFVEIALFNYDLSCQIKK